MLYFLGTGVCPKCDVAESLPEGSPCCDWFRYRNNASLPDEVRRRPPNCWPIPVAKDDHAFGLKDGLDAPAKDCIEFTRSQVRKYVVEVGLSTYNDTNILQYKFL